MSVVSFMCIPIGQLTTMPPYSYGSIFAVKFFSLKVIVSHSCKVATSRLSEMNLIFQPTIQDEYLLVQIIWIHVTCIKVLDSTKHG